MTMHDSHALAMMTRDHAALKRRLATGGAHYETREAPADMAKLTETIEQIGRTFEQYKAANDTRLEELRKKGTVTPETEDKLRKMDAALDQLEDLKKSIERLETRRARPGARDDQDEATPEASEYKTAFIDWIRDPRNPARDMALKAAHKKFETRAAQVVTSTGSAGGFALPEVIERQIARLSLDISPIRQIATVRTVSTTDYKELFDVNGAAFEWAGETSTRSQSNTPDLAEVAPTMGMASARPRASEESLDDLFFDVENWLITSAAEAIAKGESTAFVSGNGTNRPTGILAGPTPLTTADGARAFGTLQYIASGQAAAMPTSLDTFIDIVFALRARYRANAQWLSSKAVYAAMRKYKATDNNYLWQPSLVAGQPSTFMGFPVVEAEDMPAVAANAFPLAFGDFREGYLIVDRVGMRITRDEITLPGFVQFYIRKRVGGRLRNTEAIKLLRISAT
jgi:HK97 family phage major capsid protein